MLAKSPTADSHTTTTRGLLLSDVRVVMTFSNHLAPVVFAALAWGALWLRTGD